MASQTISYSARLSPRAALRVSGLTIGKAQSGLGVRISWISSCSDSTWPKVGRLLTRNEPWGGREGGGGKAGEIGPGWTQCGCGTGGTNRLAPAQ